MPASSPGTTSPRGHDRLELGLDLPTSRQVAPPSYALRLEHAGHPFTFSFELPGTSGTLCYDHATETITIQGRAYGGVKVRGSWHPSFSGYVDVDFVYTGVSCAGTKLIASDGSAGSGRSCGSRPVTRSISSARLTRTESSRGSTTGDGQAR